MIKRRPTRLLLHPHTEHRRSPTAVTSHCSAPAIYETRTRKPRRRRRKIPTLCCTCTMGSAALAQWECCICTMSSRAEMVSGSQKELLDIMIRHERTPSRERKRKNTPAKRKRRTAKSPKPSRKPRRRKPPNPDRTAGFGVLAGRNNAEGVEDNSPG